MHTSEVSSPGMASSSLRVERRDAFVALRDGMLLFGAAIVSFQLSNLARGWREGLYRQRLKGKMQRLRR